MKPTNLPDRYRRLLSWYPRDHRERHGEEMLGVLLAGAGERDRPSRKETVDLVRGALRLHLRRVVGADGGIGHRDVLAIVSLLGPIVMLAGAVTVVEMLHPMLLRHMTWDPRVYVIMVPETPAFAVWFVVAALSLLRLRKSAAAGAWLGTFAFVPAAGLDFSFRWQDVIYNAGWVVLGAVIAAALTWSAGPARGWELVGGTRVVVLAAAVATSALLVLKSFGTYGVLGTSMTSMTVFHGPGRTTLWFLALAVLVVGAVVGGGARTREGRRAALVLSVPVVVSLLTCVLPERPEFLPAVAAICYVVPIAVLLVFGGLPRRVRASA
ncbi:MAG: hypothetical protein M3422_06995 [Actinomycetota bacterium]|nr:hypothetical protein [Actinomycetota bacterium]